MSRRYPVGIQTFSKIREEGYVYVDKTDLVWKLANNFQYAFLSRPRRFGKSLLTSTLKAYFEGKKELFKGLAIEPLEQSWTEYPVLQFDMSGGKHMDSDSLDCYFDYILKEQERKFGIVPVNTSANNRVSALITHAYEQTGKPVVVLIDEYDAPLLDTMVDDEQFDKMRKMMKNFYSPLKKCDPYLRFVFLTGITKFSQLSIFSELNNIRSVSMEDEFAAICGITKEELLTQFDQDIEALAKKQELTKQEAIDELTRHYDGYHFSKNSPDIFNPFSLLNCFLGNEIDNFWYASGTTSYLIDMLRKQKITFEDIPEETTLAKEGFNVTIESYPLCGIVPMLWQIGYMSIKNHNKFSDTYTIGYPNEETKDSMALLLRSI